jgi:hypothetical protein
MAMLVSAPGRGQSTFGGLVPTSASARTPSAMVAALCVEHHAQGAAVPLLLLSEAPGLLRWDPADGLVATDDLGTAYRSRGVSRQSGLGALQATAWLEPAVPAAARRLALEVRDVLRVTSPRGGVGIERPLSGGPWRLDVDLLPERTAAATPAEPAAVPIAPAPPRVPARTLPALRGLVPVGQARLTPDGAVCVWALERYTDRAVMTLAVLRGREGAALGGTVEAWDDLGGRHRAAVLAESSRDGWTEGTLELVPGIDPAARALAVRVAGLQPGGALAGPFTFGVALPAERG